MFKSFNLSYIWGYNSYDMEEAQESTEKVIDLWSKYWIAGGIMVVHRNDITELNKDRLSLFRMTVEKLVKHSKNGAGEKRRSYIEGVRCHWIDNERKYQVGQFHTNELVPYDVAKEGIEKVNEWTNRKFNQ